MRILSDLVGNSKILVRKNFGEWKSLNEPLSITENDEIHIKINCEHKETVYDPMTEYNWCKCCRTIVK